ncbi:MAG: SDR family oxidoreductase, partial [Xanthobacteraceae bacterium]
SEMMDPLHPIGRIGMPNEVAELIAWLCSPCASFVIGANVPVDGGYVAQ